MNRLREILLATALVAIPLNGALAQSRDERPQNEARADSRRIEGGQAIQIVRSGREGSMVRGGFQDRGDTYVVRWEYPGGQVVDIVVDARTGRIIRDR